ncbi:MAG: 2'-5' RNA ligase family protein [Balneolaceae bacterium]|nr:2'-5' RNA ligase family protein [Balneolaceae bacterium]
MGMDKKYSLWLRPQGDIAFSLKQRIEKLSEKYKSPTFEPHVTLLGGLESGETALSQLTDTLAGALQPFDLILTQADIGNTFYQSVFARIKKTEEILKARETAQKLFSVEADDKKDQFPHLSLMYGDFTREQKERVLNAMGREFHIRFTVSSLLLVDTSGSPKEWKKIHSAEFAKGN